MCFNMTTSMNGWGPKSDPPWAMKPKGPMPGWMVIKVLPASDSTSSSLMNSMTMLISSCSKTSSSHWWLSSEKMLSLVLMAHWLPLENPFYSSTLSPETSLTKYSSQSCSQTLKQTVKFSLTPSQVYHYFSEAALSTSCGPSLVFWLTDPTSNKSKLSETSFTTMESKSGFNWETKPKSLTLKIKNLFLAVSCTHHTVLCMKSIMQAEKYLNTLPDGMKTSPESGTCLVKFTTLSETKEMLREILISLSTLLWWPIAQDCSITFANSTTHLTSFTLT